MIKDKALELVAALRSGEYQQGRGYLQRSNGDACCLGVACLISGSDRHERLSHHPRFGNNKEIYTLPLEIKELFGFFNKEGKRNDDNVIKIKDYGDFESLAEANDCEVPFDEIANYIEQNWEYL